MPQFSKTIRQCHFIVFAIEQDKACLTQLRCAKDMITAKLTKLSGGITSWLGEGTWTPSSEQSDYSGELERDELICLFLTLTEQEDTELWPEIMRQIATTVTELNLSCEWIQVSSWIVQARNFRVSDVLAASSKANQAHPEESISPYYSSKSLGETL